MLSAKIGDRMFVLSPASGEWESPDSANRPDSFDGFPAQEKPGIGKTSDSGGENETQPETSRPSSPRALALIADITRRENDAAQLADNVRKLSKDVGQGNPATSEHRKKLERVLDAALDMKLQLEESRIKELQTRLSKLEQQIGQRRAQRAAIIERRANELIEGNSLRWDASTTNHQSIDPLNPLRPSVAGTRRYE